MERSHLRVLLVDDYADWRRFLSSKLQRDPKTQIIGEASTGLEAVHKAEQLQPDLILIDIGLPALNGLEATRQIRILSPRSKIVVVSLTTSSEMVQEALRAGASGFVAKLDAARELIPAVQAVLQDRQFVSSSLHEGVVAGGDKPLITRSRDDVASNALPLETSFSRHEVTFYSDDAALVAGFTDVAEDALKRGRAVVIIATVSHRDGVLQQLTARGVDVATATRAGTFRQRDAKQVLESLMVNGVIESACCAKFAGEIISEAAQCATARHPSVVICGECAPSLLAAGDLEGAIRLECLWDKLVKAYDAETLCGYLRGAFSHAATQPILERICGQHSAVHF